ncbi:glycosyltransferase family 25 protein [Acinetobacter indicus]|uniref:glycosyltransferase family 25 protein n=1 Tax=Acinetobacter indicus TaxID=756892 RepID=UPI0014441AFD|nr:glycosyltransferase family 25 protein [Acinetobacter indicus]
MQVLIINLARSTERLAFQQKQFARLGLSFQRLDAVSVDEISEEAYQRLGFGWQRPLRKVEVACFLSHQKAWETVVRANAPALILEDDAVLASHVPQLLEDIEHHNFKDIDLINFEVRSRKKIISKTPVYSFANSQTNLFELYQDRTGAACYILYPSGAQKLLDKLEISAPAIADGFIFSHYSLNSLQAEPAAVIQEDQLAAYGLVPEEQFESVIGRSEHFKPEYESIVEKLSFKKRRLMGQLVMAIRYMQVIGKAEKRFIALEKDRFKQD